MIYTSYFARSNRLTDVYRVSISLSTPHWALVEDTMLVFAPTWEIIEDYKRTGDTVAYELAYFKLLQSRDKYIRLALDKLQELSKDRTVLLCCWENSNKFCHRRLLSKYLGINISEYMEEPDIFDSI